MKSETVLNVGIESHGPIREASGAWIEHMEPRLDKPRHIRYWTRCIKTLLPTQYTGTDSNRLYLAFLILSALDLLGCLATVCSTEERQDYIDWIYRCQHSGGGFRMWPGTDFGERANETNAKWDPANVPATYFALASLLILDDDFKRVRRWQTLQWLRRMQRKDGSFGETLVNGRLQGGRDPRFGYCAAGVRRILRGHLDEAAVGLEGERIGDLDVDGLVRCIRAAESFDGGISDEILHEPHAGYTFCSLGAVAFLNRLNTSESTPSDHVRAPSAPQEVIRWLVYRQTDALDPDAAFDSEFLGSNGLSSSHGATQQPETNSSTQPLHQSPDKSIVDPFNEVLSCAGMNGRTNKVADTCYAWWTGASLHILGQAKLYDHLAVSRYLLEKTQHPVLGGFGKFPGDLPDLYHSCLGLAALGLIGHPDLKEVDPGMCISKEARARLNALWTGGEVVDTLNSVDFDQRQA